MIGPHSSTLSTPAPPQRGRLRRALTWFAALLLTFTFFGMGPSLRAEAYEAATGTWTTGGVLTLPSGLTATATVSGSTAFNGVSTLGSRGFGTTTYSPTTMVTGDSTMDILVNAGTCAATGTCPGLGTLTFTFSQPVRNPTFHLSGLGAAVGNGVQQSDFHAYLDLATAGLTLTQLGSNGNFTVSGSRITAVNDSTSTSCTTTANNTGFLAAAATAACGSVRINGTMTSVTFNMGTIWVKNPSATNGTTLATAGDAFGITVTMPEDFGDAPTTYNSPQAPAHVLSDLTLGATVDEDNANVRNATAAPWAAATANGDDTNGTDDEDAFTTLPDVVAQPGAPYSLTVPISGLSKSATLCGWIDFNRNGVFDSATERQCATPAAGATSATLTWSVPTGVSVGATNARFRLGYTAAQVQSPTGLADSGEVEDYPITILPRPQIILTKTTTGAVGGPFTYALTNTTQATGTVTTVTAGTAVQVDGDTGTAGTQAYTVSAVNTDVSITEAALAGWSVTTAVCTNAGGTVVGTLSGAAYTIPASAVVPGAVITCAFTNAKPALTFKKSNAGITDLDGNGPDAGDTVTYSYLVTNTGQTSLSGVTVTDDKVASISCPVTTLAVGASVTCQGTYTLLQADVTAGSVTNLATATANPPSGAALTATDTNTVTIPANPKVSLTKSAGTPTGNTAGSTVTYTFVVANTGNLPLTSVGVSDPKVGPVSCPVSTLAPGASTTCTKTYTLTQADVNSGSVVNTATASGTSPTGTTVTATANATSTISRTATITLVKTAGTPSGTTAGSTLGYSFLVTNTGNVTLTGITISDAKIPGYTCPVTTLAPGANTTCTATHTITQAEIDAGVVTNFATVTGTPPTGMSNVTANGTTSTTLTRTPAVSLDKQFSGISGQTAGSTVSYSFVVSNTGNVTLTGLWLQDAKVTSTSCPSTTLAVGAAVTCTGTYTLTQADVDAGHVSNTATATAYGPNGNPATSTDTVDTPVTPGPTISLTKTAGTPSGNTAGSTITYTFVVKNTGNVTLTSVGVTDPKVGPVTCSPTTLAPGATVTCTKTYTLTQADVNAGSVVNTATASGTSPTNVTVQATSSATATITRTTSLSFDKQAGTPSGATAGSTIPYSFVVQNTGNVTLTSLTVSDTKVGSVSCPATTLLPGASTTCTGTYTITQNDVDSGHVANTATATATPPSGMTAPTGTDTTDTPITAAPAITLTKSAGTPSGMTAGSTITYSFLVTNSGNVTLTGVGVSDPKVGPVTCPVTTLLPGASVTCTKSYTLTLADVNAGVVNNTATASGTPPTGAAVTATSSTSTTITRTPAVTLTKTAGTPSGTVAGSTIPYTFLVTNTGNVTLTSVGVSDPKVTGVSCPVSTLVPGASTTCTATYVLTQADVDAGVVNNTATASGTPPTGAAVTATSSTTTTITRSPSITLTKTAGTPSGATAGSTIAYTFLVKNTGNVTLTSVGVSDPKVGTVTCPVTTLAPGATTTCTKTYTLLQSDVDAGTVNNTATATGTPPTGSAVTATSSVTTPITRTPALTFDKQAGTPSGTSAGSTILFTFVITNTGNVTLTSVGVTDAKVGAITCSPTTLAPGASVTCTKSYTLTQADVDAGHVANTATASGTPPTGPAVTATDATDTPIAAGPAITLTKTAGTPSGASAGSTIAYTFVVKNTGNVTLTGVGVSDPKVGAVTCPVTTLAPGASTTCTTTYTLTQADVDAGTVNNTATASGTPPTGSAVTATSSVVTPITRTPALTFDKQAGVPSGSTAGSTIAYTFVVTNTGNVTLTSVGVTDAKVGTITCPVTTLAPGASTSCTKTYTVTQADVDAGHVANTATGTGTPPSGSAVTAADTTDTSLTQTPTITLTKTAGTPSGMTAGSTLLYTFVVKNTGNVTLTSVGVSDPKVGPVSCPATSLAPGASTTCTKTYTLTQADVDAGTVNNTATASGTPPTGPVVTATSSVVTPITRTPAVSFDKQAGTPSGSTAGSTILYTFIVSNTGNTTLTSVGVTDAKVGAITCSPTTLAPGASVTCTKTYTVTQADVDSGHVANTATASATPPSGSALTANDTTDTPLTRAPAITLAKTAGTPSGMTAGSTILYTFVVTNTGNVSLTGVGVTDPKVGTVSCPATSLAPGASTTCTKSYTLTQADVDAGTVNNTATATGTPPTGSAVTATSSVVTPITRTPAVTFDKQAGTPTGMTAGSTIPYTFIVTNAGNTTLTSVGVTDAKVGTITCSPTTLAPGASVTCTKTYTITQADVDAGHVANTATAKGTSPSGGTVTASDATDTPITAAPAITLTKSAGTPSGNTAGSTILYTFVVKNTGNVTLTSVGVSDPMVGTVSCPVTTLAPNASTTCTKSYTLTQADVDAGHVANTATASGTPPTGAAVTATSSTTTPIASAPAITAQKQAGTPSGATAGSTIAYTVTVTNTGNVTLTGVGVTDPLAPVTCPVATLAPGASTTCTASYTLTQADVDAGVVNNTATASGTPPTGSAVTATSSATAPITATPAITLDKQAATPTGTGAGSTIPYTFVVTNTGNVTLTAVGITDAKVGAVTCPVTTLAPGATTTCTATYVLTQADVDSGHVANSATASGTSPKGPKATATDTTDTAIPAGPAITVTKTASKPTVMAAGGTITYTIVVRNTGNVTLTAVAVSDPKVGPVTCPATTLAPGASTTCTKTYTLTQADVDAGGVDNTATATGTPPTGDPVTGTSTVHTPVTTSPAISFDKQAGTPTGATAGSTIGYSFVVTNTGNVTLTSVTVTDSKVGVVTCPVATLAPGATTTCTATYTLTQADVDSGHVANSANVTANPPTGPPVTGTDSTDTPITSAPSLTLDKVAGTPSGTSAGSTIPYTFLVTNTGNVTLTSVAVSDPKVGAVTCPTTTLAPGAATTCAATYTLSQADVDAGHVANTATARSNPPSGAAVTSTDSTDTVIAAAPSLSLDKQAGTPTGATAGSTLSYTFLVTNTGNVTLTGVGVTDAKVGTVSCPVTTLAPGAHTTCTATYTLTQADVDAGHVANTASAAGTPPTGAPVQGTDSTDTTITASPKVSFDKQAGVPTAMAAGGTIAYTFLVTNSGNVTLHQVAVTDAKVGTVTCQVTTLAPGASTSCSATYTLTQADVDSGHVANTAQVSATPPTGSPVTADDTTDTPVLASPSLTMVKHAGTPTVMAAGGTISYTFLATNTGNVTLHLLGVTDPKVGTVFCPVTTLEPGEHTTCTSMYTLTQADVDAGHVPNSAIASATPPSGVPVTATDSVDTVITPSPSITLVKSASAPTGTTAGSVIHYSFLVTNTGNVTLSAVAIADAKTGPVTCPPASLAPGSTTTCTVDYTLTQADVDAGHVANTATASATPPVGEAVTATSSTDTTLPSSPAIAIDKQAGTPTGTTAGSTITYSFVVANTGNVTLTGIVVADPKVGTVTCPVTTLAPGASTTCTKTYGLTQADVDAGHVANTATVTANPPTGSPVTARDTVDTPIASTPSISLDKQSSAPSGNTAGSTIGYTFLVTNTGNVTLTGITVDDPKVFSVTCPVTTLAPGAHTLCTTLYTVKQADVDAGQVANTATVKGNPPTGAAVTASDSVVTPIAANPQLALDKQAGTASGTAAGATISYTFVVSNTGNLTLTGISVTDPVVGTVTCPVTTLAPGTSTTCTAAPYVTTQADFDAGHRANTATAQATPPFGLPVTATDSTDTVLPDLSDITLVKKAGTPTGNTVGSTIPYTFLVTNTGNLTLSSIGISDPVAGTVTCPVTTLAPLESTTCTAQRVLTQADVDAGHVTNTAVVSASEPDAEVITATDSVNTPITSSPAVTLVKKAGTPSGTTAGSTVPYTFLVTNTGNVTLTGVVVTDPTVGTVTCAVTTLAPGASTTCTATYALTQGDVDAGHLHNTAAVSANPPSGSAVNATDSVDTPITATPSITVDKKAGALSGATAGSTLPYTFDVTNTGNVTLHAVTVDDPLVGTVSCPVGTLAPGAHTTCTATYVLTQADVDAGHVTNSATASGTPPIGSAVAGQDSTDTVIPAAPGISLDKQAGAPSAMAAGGTIAYSFVVTNTGNVTLTSLAVADAKVGTVLCLVTTLAPGATTTCTATYVLTQADVDAGQVANTATASATPPTGSSVTSTDSTLTTITQNAQLVLDKQAGAPTGATAGSTITYAFHAANTGNVTVHLLSVTDPAIGTVFCPVTVLAPGENTTCTATYTLTQVDVDAGHIANTAIISAMPPSGPPITSTDSTDRPIEAGASISLVKQAGTATGATAGSTVPYTFVVTNSGNVTLTSVVVSDAKVGTVTCPDTTLAPGAHTTCTATYTLTQANVDAGHVANTATVTGNPPTGDPVMGADSTDSPIPAAPRVTLDKVAGVPTGSAAGETIPYDFVVTNTGNVTLHSVSVDDPKVGAVVCPATTLAPGDSTTCTATYTLTQADVDAGHVANTATVSATPPIGVAVTGTDSTDTPLAASPGLSLDKQAGTPSANAAGATLPYTFVVTNTGNVTLHSVLVTDLHVVTVSCPVTTLAPGATVTCTATEILSQADVDLGHVDNTATASGTPPTGAPVTSTDSTTTPIPAAPAMTLDKQAGTASGATAGSTLPYTFLVTNTGNVTLTAVVVDDPAIGAVSCPRTTLLPGEHTTCTATYTLTQADVDAGHVVNTATVSGTPPTGGPATGTDTVDTPIAASPKVTLDKQAGSLSGTSAGATLPYTFVVTNTGNVTLTAVTVHDPLLSGVTCDVTALAPGEHATCTATYVLTQADVDAGHRANLASVSANPPSGAPVTASDSTDTPIAAAPSIALDKQVGTPTGNAAGATVPYTFVVQNTGNVTLTAVAVSDPTVGTVTCPVTVLAPGASTTCTATYVLTQADADSGQVANTATVAGRAPSGTTVTATDSTVIGIVATTSITLDKQAGSLSGATAGSTLPYTFVVTNTGTVTVTGLTVADALVTVTCPTATLLPGARTTCTATYVLTQADVDAGHVANTATATATPPSGPAVTAKDSTDTPIAPSAAVTLDKRAGTPSGATAGSTIAYTFVITNTGNVTLTSVAVADALTPPVTCPVTTLAPGAGTTCTVTYTLTQADVDAGHVANSATVSATPPAGPPVTSTDTTDTTITAAPGVTLDKVAGTLSGTAAGATLPYTFVVQNTGNVTLTGITVADPKAGTVTCPVTTLAPGTGTTCTATYTLSQDDVDAGSVVNTATVSANPPSGSPVTASDSTETTVAASPSMTLDKQAGTPSGTTAGSTIPYTFVVTNTGNVTLDTMAIDDPMVGTVSCPVTTLAPGEQVACTATYALTQADVDSGLVVNNASVSADPPTGAPVTSTDWTDTPIAASPALELDKRAGTPTGATVGSTIPYTFVVANTGNVTLTGVTVDDPKVGAVVCPLAPLAPGATTTCTATYTLTQADVDAGHVANSATASATPPTGAPVTGSDSTDTPITAAPSVTFDKQAGTLTGTTAGSTLPYTFVVTNTGNVTLTGIVVSDVTVGTVTCPVTTLAPGAQTTCTALYRLTQADVDAGHVANTALVTATPPTGSPVTGTDSTDTTIAASPSITLDKQAGSTSANTVAATLPYTFVITNTGNVTLTAVTITDPKVGAVACTVTVLAPHATTTCTATYTLTQADVDAGHVANTATVSADPPSGDPVTASDSTDTPITAAPLMTLTKSAGAASGATAGSTIPYSFVVSNAGNVTLSGIAVADPKVGAVTCPVTTLAPGASTTCTATYVLTQADVDAGHVANSAVASATQPNGDPVTAGDAIDTLVPASPSVTLDKQAGAATGATAGKAIPYTFLVTNTGNVTLVGIVVADPLVGPVTCPTTTLAPGSSTTCTATYVLTQADVDAGHVRNTAIAVALPPTGAPVNATDSVDTVVPASPSVTLDKQAGTPSGTTAGSTIHYDFVVANTGNVTLTGVTVSDPKVGGVSCPVTTLAPGASTTCTATYALTQADVDAGHALNTATVSATPPTGSAVTGSDSTDTALPAHPSVSLDKQAGTPSGATAGSTIVYSFVVTNTGNVTVSSVVVDDSLLGAVSCPVTTLAPSALTTCTATYALTQADVDAGHRANTATVSATPPTGAAVTSTDSTDTPLAPAPSMTLDKQAGTPSGATAGSTLAYTFVVTNTGNVTLHSVAVSDPKVGTVSCPATTLAPGEQTTCTATYVLTQADVDAGHVANTASVSGTTPKGATTGATDQTDTPIAAHPSASFDKQAGTPSGSTAGSTIHYAFVITNTGNVTLSGIAVDDPKVTSVSCPVTTLAPGATTTCTATYVITQADVDAGQVHNTATLAATAPAGDPVSNQDSTTTTLPASPSVTLDKQSGTASGATAGSTIPYTFTVTNTGNVTLSAITVADPKVGTVTCPVTPLAPGASTTCTATYVLLQADVDAGHVLNTATVTATSPAGPTVTATDTNDAGVPAQPSVHLVKTAGTPSGSVPGSTVPYTFVVTNTGNVTLTSLYVDDPIAPATCPASTLAPGQQLTCTATYTLKQSDIDAGHVFNAAAVTGTPPKGGTVTDTAFADTPLTTSPSMMMVKRSASVSGSTAGSTIVYEFVVTNTGNVTLHGLSISDPLVGAVTCPATTVAPAATVTCTATYAMTQAEVDAGVVHNTATATATSGLGVQVTADGAVDVPIVAHPRLTLVKKAGVPDGNTAGSTMAYSFVVTNLGNVTLTGVVVSDPLVGAVTCPTTTLAPGAHVTCTATYVLTQDDIDAGHVLNTATATANPPAGAPVDGTSTVDSPIVSTPGLVLDKQAGTPTGATAGSTIPYTFVVSNTGNVTLSDVQVTDPLVGAVSCPATSVAPQDSMTCTGQYVLTQADVDAGTVVNHATAEGTSPLGDPVTSDDTTVTSIPSSPSLTLVKTAGTPTGTTAGSTITYSMLVTNTGNVTLDHLTVLDPTAGPVTCPVAQLAPGEATTCTVTYALTQTDVDAGHIENTAHAYGNPPAGDPADLDHDATASSTVDTTLAQQPSVTIHKTATAPATVGAGIVLPYTFVVTNTGNVTLTGITVADPKVGTVSCPATTLAPGEHLTCTASYVLTQADLDLGHVTNHASVTADPPAGEPVGGDDTVTTRLAQKPSLTFSKMTDATSAVSPGMQVSFTFLVTNDGNVTLTSVVVNDPMLTGVSCPVTTLAPGEHVLCTSDPYTVTEADAAAGKIVNTAVVEAMGAETTATLTASATAVAIVSGGHLPNTGSPVGIEPLVTSLVILGLGIVLTLAGRRRRTPDEQPLA